MNILPVAGIADKQAQQAKDIQIKAQRNREHGDDYRDFDEVIAEEVKKIKEATKDTAK